MTRNGVVISIIALFSVIACREPAERLREPADLALGFREVAELGTLEVHFTKIIVGEKEAKKKWLFLTGSSRALHVAMSEAVVRLGIDLNRLAPDDVKVSGERISVLLPPIEILDFNYDPTRFQVDNELSDYHRTGTLSLTSEQADFRASEIEEVYRKAERQVREQLPYKKLQRMGERRTALFFSSYLEKAGFREVFVNFKEGDFASFRKGGAE